ncbi:MAG: TonB-dependent receptor [Bacteroidia bacterium]|nr:TonB-dependent receptor [Bacteroidia bacterium]
MNKFLCLLLAWLSFSALGQNIIIRDNSTREPIYNVSIKDKNNNMAITDIKGVANINTLDKTDSLLLYNAAYSSKKIIFNGENMLVDLSAKLFQLDEIIFSANRKEEKKIDVPYTIEVVKQKDIEFANQPTTGEVMQNTGAVFVQKSQMGGSSPVLRGFEASRVLMVVDGVRMNNAIYRSGHLQDIITIDANMLDRAEIIFGPSSTIYGSDALGGVMHFYTKNAQFSQDDKMLVKVNGMGRYATANKETTGHLDFNLGWKKFASLTNITYTKFDDLMSGSTKLTGYYKGWDRQYYSQRFGDRDSMIANSNDNLQVGTGYDQLDIMQRFNIKTGEHLTHNINFQMSQSSDVPRYDRLTEIAAGKLRFAEWKYGPQKRLLGAYTLNFDGKTKVSDNIKVILAYQKIEQDRITRRFQNNNRVSQMEDVTVLSTNVDVYKNIKEKHELRYGLELTSNDVQSTANNLNIVTNSVSPAATRYADGGSKMSSAAIYISHAWEVNEKFVITDGLRFTGSKLTSTFNDTTFYKFPFKTVDQKSKAVTGSLGFTWKDNNNYKVSFLVNTGFRTPNVDDMTKVFASAGTILVVPNPEIKPEYATNFELGISKIFEGRYKFDMTGFYTVLEDALVQRDFKFNGQDSALFNGVKSKVQAMQNVDRAYIYGFTSGVQFDFNDNISFKSIINYTYGRYVDTRKDTVVPLDHIPPVFGQTSIIYKAKSTDVEFFVRYNGKKASADYSASGEDNAVYSADPAKGYMPAWFTLNIRAGYNFTKNIRLNVACENLTDNRYRVFASGINAPGRNFIISLRYKI